MNKKIEKYFSKHIVRLFFRKICFEKYVSKNMFRFGRFSKNNFGKHIFFRKQIFEKYFPGQQNKKNEKLFVEKYASKNMIRTICFEKCFSKNIFRKICFEKYFFEFFEKYFSKNIFRKILYRDANQNF